VEGIAKHRSSGCRIEHMNLVIDWKFITAWHALADSKDLGHDVKVTRIYTKPSYLTFISLL
jgi:hypothetical protein